MIYLRNRYYDPSMGRFITEDPVKDGLNWYGYCNGNPVMFVDPWGLAPGDLIEDSLLELSEAQLNNVRSAVDARKGGYITKQQFAENVMRNGAIVERFPGISVSEYKNTITITVFMSIDNTINEKTRYSAGSYQAEIINGITDEWSGQYTNKSIVTNIVVKENDNVYDTVNITLSAENGASYGDMGSGNDITLRIVSGAKLYTPKELGKVAAHEFGHAAFRLRDLYTGSYKKMGYNSIKSIMNKPLETGRTDVDFALMFTHSLFKATSSYTKKPYDSILNTYK